MNRERKRVSGWGRHLGTELDLLYPTGRSELERGALDASNLIARGLGRSYGDAAQRSGGTGVVTTECTDVEWVDREHGIIRADAGVAIGALIDRFAPKGWFVPVTPGTRQVTVGGAIAADIHGKNHHVDGGFGVHCRSLTLRLADDSVVAVAPDSVDEDDRSLFWATVGGMGLTGVITSAVIGLTPLPSTKVRVETERLSGRRELLAAMVASDAEHTFSVAWVDLLHGERSVLTQGSFALPDQLEPEPAGRFRQPGVLQAALPPVPLPRLAHTAGVRVFNELWWRRAPQEPTVTNESVTAFFHPLDAIRDWNRVYGGVGFVQWQCVVPDAATAALDLIIDRLHTLPAYFTVLKRLGAANPAPLSFPIAGWTLAVDLPATTRVLGALGELDAIVAECGGRIYLAKDARMDRATFETMYPHLERWRETRDRVDPHRRFTSDLATRLDL